MKMQLLFNGTYIVLFVALLSFVSIAISTEPSTRVGNKLDYAGYKLLHINSTEWIRRMLTAEFRYPEVDIWSRSNLLVSPGAYPKVEQHLKSLQVYYKIASNDLPKLIRAEREDISWKGWKSRRSKRQHAGWLGHCDSKSANVRFPTSKRLNTKENLDYDYFRDIPLHIYLTYCQVQNWLNEMVQRYGEVMSLHTYGHSYENRSLIIAKIGLPANSTSNNQNDTFKPIIWVDGGIHAREWISVSSALYLIHKLVTNYASDFSMQELLRKYDFYIAPLLNPDGYHYSFDHDRFWRKTRCLTIAPKCRGVDANRNFNFHWGGCRKEFYRVYLQCLPTYAGKRPFSEPETYHFSRYFWSIRHMVKIYLSLHAYGNIWFLPYGYSEEKPPDYEQLLNVSERAIEEIWKLHGVKYEAGTPGDLIYFACGGSYDWVKGRAGVKYSFTMEIGNDTAGFTSPPRLITKLGMEVHTGLIALLRAIEETDSCWISPQEC